MSFYQSCTLKFLLGGLLGTEIWTWTRAWPWQKFLYDSEMETRDRILSMSMNPRLKLLADELTWWAHWTGETVNCCVIVSSLLVHFRYRFKNADGSITWGYKNEDGSFKVRRSILNFSTIFSNFKSKAYQAVFALGCYHQISFASNINNYSLGEFQFMIRNPRSPDKLGYSLLVEGSRLTFGRDETTHQVNTFWLRLGTQGVTLCVRSAQSAHSSYFWLKS